MAADTKVVQSMVNHAAEAVENIRKEVQVIQEVLAEYDALSPSTSGTVLQGNETKLREKLSDLIAMADDPLLDTVIAAKVPSHRRLF